MTPFISSNKIYSLDISGDAKSFLATEFAKNPQAGTVLFVNGFEEEVKERELLNKIMQALKLTPDDYLLIDKVKYPGIRLRHLALEGFSNVTKCLLFGVHPSEVGLNVSLQDYAMRKIGDISLLLSDPAPALMKQEGLKRALWSEIKKVYNI